MLIDIVKLERLNDTLVEVRAEISDGRTVSFLKDSSTKNVMVNLCNHPIDIIVKGESIQLPCNHNMFLYVNDTKDYNDKSEIFDGLECIGKHFETDLDIPRWIEDTIKAINVDANKIYYVVSIATASYMVNRDDIIITGEAVKTKDEKGNPKFLGVKNFYKPKRVNSLRYVYE